MFLPFDCSRSISIHAPRVRCDPRLIIPVLFPSNFNPRTSCEVRRAHAEYELKNVKISIHAPRVRCDTAWIENRLGETIISIHAPRVRCDHHNLGVLRRAEHNFNPRTSCEVRRVIYYAYAFSVDISIHAPRVRCDYFNFGILVKILEFQSTHLV